MLSFEMLTVSAISRTFNRRFINTRSWILFTLSSVVAVFGAPGRGSSKTDVRRATTLKLVKPIFDGRHRRRRVTVHGIQALFDFAARFPSQKQESSHRPIFARLDRRPSVCTNHVTSTLIFTTDTCPFLTLIRLSRLHFLRRLVVRTLTASTCVT